MRDFLRRFTRPTRDERRAQHAADVWFIVGASYLLLAFAYLWPHDLETSSAIRTEWFAFMVRVLQFHIGLLAAAMAVYALARRRWRAALGALPLLAFTLGPVAWSYVHVAQPRPSDGPSVRLMTMNLLVSNDRHAAIASEIKRSAPDVVVLQEYSDPWDEALRPELSTSLPTVLAQTRDDSFGTAVFTSEQLPRDAQTTLQLASGETPQTRTVVTVGSEEVALYNVHLLPPITLDYVREGRRELADLIDIVEEDPLPVIIVGDLNLTDTTPQHAWLEQLGLRDAWDLRGRGRGATWPNNSILSVLPGLRLDHVYVSRQIAVTDVRIGEGCGSDHRPVIVDLAMRS